MKKNVLLLETIEEQALNTLKQHTEILFGINTGKFREALRRMPVHAVITRSNGHINRELIDACPDLEVIARCGVGLDNVDIAAATEKKILVLNTPGANAATVAEHTLALMLVAIRDLTTAVMEVKHNNWKWRNRYFGDELNGKTLGIIGLGNIGKRVAVLGDTFGMNVVYWSRSVQPVPYPRLTLEEVLRRSDVVSLHIPYTPGSPPLIGAGQLSIMKPGALLVNTARGALIDQTALLQALDGKKIAGFAADVLQEEPPAVFNRLVHHPYALITPHVSSLTQSTYRQMSMQTVQNVIRVLTGEMPDTSCIVNRRALEIG